MAPSDPVNAAPVPRERGVYRVQDWAEVQRLFHREGVSKRHIARRLGMSRTTVIRLLALPEPPRYKRRRAGSQLDPYRDEIAAMLAADPTVAATVILEHLRRSGYRGGITILEGPRGEGPPRVHRRPGLPAHQLSAGRDRPARLVAHRPPDPGRQGPDERGVRPRRDPAPLGRPRGRVHPGAHDGRLLCGAARLSRAPRRRRGEGGLRQRRLDRREAGGRPGPAPRRPPGPVRRPALPAGRAPTEASDLQGPRRADDRLP